MSMMMVRRPIRNVDRLHPFTRPNRPAHPFGVGLLPRNEEQVEPTSINASGAAPTGSWDLSSINLDAKIPAGPAEYLTIKDVAYQVERFTGQDGTACVRLVKQAGDGEVYDVSRGADGEVSCTCPDFTFKRAGTGATCKHGTAAVGAGLLKPTAAEASAWISAKTAERDAEAKARGVTRRHLDAAWQSGWSLGSSGGDGYPPDGLSFYERAAWRNGLDAGQVAFGEGLAIDAVEQAGVEVIEEEWAEARCRPAMA